MKRSDRDRLMELAFGELGADEAAMLEAQIQLDPKAAQTLTECRALRSGLESLRTVPEDQLSIERLRAAVLNRGLKPGADRGWTWVPASAAAFALAVVGVRYLIHPDTKAMVNAPNALSEVGGLAARVAHGMANELASPVTSAKQPVVHEVPAMFASNSHATHHRLLAENEPVGRPLMASMMTTTHPFADPAGATPPAGSAENAGTAAPSDSGGSESIVLLRSNPNAKSPADSVNNATEVANGTDLIVGG